MGQSPSGTSTVTECRLVVGGADGKAYAYDVGQLCPDG
jgi:hypothetical protein